MHLVLHHFRKDARQFQIYLALWFGLLLLDLAVNMGWVGQVVYSPAHGFDQAANTWTGLLPVVIWALIGLLPSLVVLADSPARREGFLATRPLPKRDLLLAKIFFVFALVVAPWVLQEFIHLVWSGVSAWVVERGSLERLMFTLPVAFGCAAFAALWPSPARWARAIGILFLCYVLTALEVSFCIDFFHLKSDWMGPNKAPIIVNFYAFVLALAVFAIWHSRAHRGVLARWGGLILVAVISLWAASFWPWENFKLQPANPAEAKAMLAQVGFEIPMQAVFMNKLQDASGRPETKFVVNVVPATGPLPAGQVVEWAGKGTKLVRATGDVIQGSDNSFPAEVFNAIRYNYYFHPADFAAWAAEFPEDVLFREGDFAGQNLTPSLVLGTFKLPTTRAEMSAPLALQADLEARVFQWRKIADLPLTPGATATDEFGSWKYVAQLNFPKIPQGGVELFLERRQINLYTATDSRCSSALNGPLTRMVFMVYDPARHLVWMPDQNFYSAAERGTQSALTQYFLTLSFMSQKNHFTAAAAEHCRLIVFEKTWTGSVPEKWQSAAFTLDDKIQSSTPVIVANNQPMPQNEFRWRVAALAAPAPDASRREVSLYLLDFLRLVDAQRFPLQISDPLTAQLARFVPAHLDLLLDGLPVMSQASQATIINAIKLGATQAQKTAIIAALPKLPQLAEVLLARDWVADARPEIYQLANSPNALPLDAMRAIAWFNDPQTYPRLLEEFKAAPSVAMDDLLRTLPGMEISLNTIVAQHWRANSLVLCEPGYEMFDESFRLAMRHGETSALQRAYQALEDPLYDSQQDMMMLANPLTETVQMSGLKPENRYDSAKVFAWMRQHRPEDFIFSPARRQFVLKPNLVARETVSAQHP